MQKSQERDPVDIEELKTIFTSDERSRETFSGKRVIQRGDCGTASRGGHCSKELVNRGQDHSISNSRPRSSTR